GFLRKVKGPPRRQPACEEPPRRIKVDGTHQYCFIHGGWHLVTVKKLPPDLVARLSQNYHPTLDDAALGRMVSVPEAVRLYGAPVSGVASRRLSKRELRQLPIPID